MKNILDSIQQAESRPGAQRGEDVRWSPPAQHRAFVARAKVTDALQQLPPWSGTPVESTDAEVVAQLLQPDSWAELHRWSHGMTGVRLYRSHEDPTLVRMSMAAEPIETVGIVSGFRRQGEAGPQQELFARQNDETDGAFVQFGDGSCVWVQFAVGSPDLVLGHVVVSLGVGLEYPVAPVLAWLDQAGDAPLEALMERTLGHLPAGQKHVLIAGMLARLAEPGRDVRIPDEQLAWAQAWTPLQTATVNAWAEQLAATLCESLLEQQQEPDPVTSDDLYSAAWRLRAMAERRDLLENLLVLLRERRSSTLNSVLATLDEVGADLVLRTGLRVTFETELLERAAGVCPIDWWTGGTLDRLLDEDLSLLN